MTNNIRHVSTVTSEISHGCLHHSLLATSQMVNKMTINTSRKREEDKRKKYKYAGAGVQNGDHS